MLSEHPHSLYEEYIYLYDEIYASDYLNWIDPDELSANAALLSEPQRRLLELLNTKREHFGDSFNRGNYFLNAYPLVAAEAPVSTRLVCCGRKTSWNGTGSCQKWRFCSRCAFARQHATLGAFLPAFHHASFAFGTIAIDPYLLIARSSDLKTIIPIWDAMGAAVKGLKHIGYIEGAFFVEEVALVALLPLRVQPHVHAVFHLGSNQETCGAIQATLAESLCSIGLAPSVEIVPLETEESFANHLRYTTKALDIASSYQSALHESGNANLSARLEINSQLRTFLRGWTQLTHGRYTINRIGSMHHASSSYIGTKDWSPKDRREYIYNFFAELATREKGIPEAA